MDRVCRAAADAGRDRFQSDANSSRATMSLCFQLATLYQAGQPAAEASGIPTDFER